jgi:uncharacterized protein YuzB (UPF0349 family)
MSKEGVAGLDRVRNSAGCDDSLRTAVYGCLALVAFCAMPFLLVVGEILLWSAVLYTFVSLIGEKKKHRLRDGDEEKASADVDE